MKVVLFMAQSLNGVIATKDFKEDFLSHENWKTFVKLADDFGCIIIGRKTHELVSEWKEYNFDDVAAIKIVVSRNATTKLPKGFVLAKSPRDAVKLASKLGFRKALLTGGSKLNAAFLQEHLIAEIIVNIEPCIIGEGIGLFADVKKDSRLKLLKTKTLASGIIQLRYSVKK